MEVAYREPARRVRAATNRIPPEFSMQFYNSANQLAAAEIENGPVGSEREGKEFSMTRTQTQDPAAVSESWCDILYSEAKFKTSRANNRFISKPLKHMKKTQTGRVESW